MKKSTQLMQYFCSGCGILLKELIGSSQNLFTSAMKEECPKCGSSLSKSMKRRWISSEQQLLAKQEDKLNHDYDTLRSSDLLLHQQQLPKSIRPPLEIQSAYDFIGFAPLDIKKIDSCLNCLTVGESLCIIGEEEHANMLLTRIYVRALMSRREGGFDSPHVILIDAGNNSDVYQCINFARQYGLNIKNILQRIIVSRAFTIYQLANLIIYELAEVIKKCDTKIIIVSDLLDMFIMDPNIDSREARFLIKEIIYSLRKMMRMSNILIVVSFNTNPKSDPNRNHDYQSIYSKILLPKFDKRIETSTSKVDPLVLDLEINNNKNNKSSNSSYGRSKFNRLQLQEKELRIIRS
jgi:hypothetical protein